MILTGAPFADIKNGIEATKGKTKFKSNYLKKLHINLQSYFCSLSCIYPIKNILNYQLRSYLMIR